MIVSKIAGIQPSAIGLHVLRGSGRPVLPSTRDRTLVVPGRDGALDFGADLEPRYFQLECAFITRSPADLQEHADTLAKLLVDARGKPRTVDLVFSVHPERTYSVRYSGSLPIDRLVGMGRFALPLVAYDPYAYLVEPILDSDILLDSDIRLGGESYDFTITGNTTVNLRNEGPINLAPAIEIAGTFTTISITANGKTLQYVEAINNQTLVIDGEMMTAKVGTTNKLSKISGSFIDLVSGDNSITISGAGLNCTVTFMFKSKYL